MTPLAIALAAASLGYAAVIAWLLAGIGRSRRSRPEGVATPAVSIVVAARNEAANLPACLAALGGQHYGGSLQVVVVDDRSTDATGAVLAGLQRRWHGAGPLTVVRAPSTPRYACPKKSALAAGIEASDGELLLFTDADCTPPPRWAAALAARFAGDVGLVAGFACTEPTPRLRHRLLAVDNLGVQALAEGSIGMGAPLSCTGRSLAYRRAVWDEVGGFDAIGHLVSGDDVYFLRLVAARTAWRVAYCADAGAVVTGPPGPSTLAAIVQQKLRHASKAGRYRGGARWLGAGVYAYHALLLAGLVAALTGVDGAAGFAAAWGARWGADALLLARFAPRGRRDRVLLTFLPVVELLYLPYVLLFVPLGRCGLFRWKPAATPLPATASTVPEESG